MPKKKLKKIIVQRFHFFSCPSGTQGIIYSVDIDGCPDSPCVVDHGDVVTGEVVFEAGFNADYIDCEIYGIIGGIVSYRTYF